MAKKKSKIESSGDSCSSIGPAKRTTYKLLVNESPTNQSSIRPLALRVLLHPKEMERRCLSIGAFAWVSAPESADLTMQLQQMSLSPSVDFADQKVPAILWPSNQVPDTSTALVSETVFDNLKRSSPDIDTVTIEPIESGAAQRFPELLSLNLELQSSKMPKHTWEHAAIKEILYEYRLLSPGMKVQFYLGNATYIGTVYFESGAQQTYHRTSRNMTVKLSLRLADSKVRAIKGSKVPEKASVDDSVGGYAKEIKLLHDMVVSPLCRPEAFSQLGLPLPKGVLLYGPPGTGKTMLAKAVAREADAELVVIESGEIISKYMGETEARLRQIWTDASKRRRCLLFIDEIDSLCPSRSADGTSELERRIVATFLTLMDGANSGDGANHFMILAATNRPNALDEALRRPGRFDCEVEIGIPTASDRLCILEKLLRSVKHCLSQDEVKSIADRTHGYVGADLVQLVRVAGIEALHLSLPALGASEFEIALARVQPSAMREVSLEVTKVHWSDIGGQHSIKKRLREAIEWPLKHADAFKKFGVSPPKGLLLYGPPGCSKTMLAKALATECGLNFLAVQGPELFNKYVGESERGVRDIFKKARQAAPSILFFDEIDAIAVRRSGTESSVNDRMLTQMLTEMDGVECLNNVTVVAATNRPDIIDPALLRPGRIDRILYVGPPDDEARVEIFRKRLSKMAVNSDETTPELLSRATAGFSGAECVSICQDAALRAMEESFEISHISKRHFDAAFANIKPRITLEMIKFYENFRDGVSVKSI